jgi:hypothetical protein
VIFRENSSTEHKTQEAVDDLLKTPATNKYQGIFSQDARVKPRIFGSGCRV